MLHRIDELYTEDPTRGQRRMHYALRNVFGLEAGRDAIYPKKKLSNPNQQHKKYPYLLRNVRIDRVNQVWSTDITYIRLKGGFVYLTAIVDWYSRFVLSWRLSTTLDASFCAEALQEALERFGKPEIFNTDQGSQFLSARLGSRSSLTGQTLSCRCIFWKDRPHEGGIVRKPISKWLFSVQEIRPLYFLPSFHPLRGFTYRRRGGCDGKQRENLVKSAENMPKWLLLSYFKDLKFYSQKGIGFMVKNDDRWLSIGEICAHLGVSSDTVYKWIEKQGLPAHRMGRLWKFQKPEVDAWVKSGQAGEK